jgi:hypothetical protein
MINTKINLLDFIKTSSKLKSLYKKTSVNFKEHLIKNKLLVKIIEYDICYINSKCNKYKIITESNFNDRFFNINSDNIVYIYKNDVDVNNLYNYLYRTFYINNDSSITIIK